MSEGEISEDDKEVYTYEKRLLALDRVLNLNLKEDDPEVSTAFGSRKSRVPWLKLPQQKGSRSCSTISWGR